MVKDQAKLPFLRWYYFQTLLALSILESSIGDKKKGVELLQVLFNY